MHKPLATTAAAAALIVSLAACSYSDPEATGDAATPPAGTVAPTTPEPSPNATGALVAEFGQTATYPDGVAVKLDFLGWRPATETTDGAVDGRIALFNISVTNNSPTEIEGALLSFPQLRAGPNNTRILIAADADALPGVMSTILPGESQQALAVYGIPADVAGDVRVEFPSLKFVDPPIIFKGALPPT
jgi:hypothetical protein